MNISKDQQIFYPGYYDGRLIPHGPFLEEWKDVIGAEGHYMISNYGRVKSLPKLDLKHYSGCLKIHLEEKILKCVKQKLGYLRVHIRTPNVNRLFFVHRLVAAHFLNNPDDKPHVNHIRGITDDNMVTQIEWHTVKENRLHGIHFLKTISRKRGKPCAGAWKPIVGRSIESGEVKTYKAVKHSETDGFSPTAISACLKNKQHSHNGYLWNYKYKKHASK